ncbi:N-6 DNA methylase [Haladaptatus sp. AB618]|uniref:Eco57I restriction-modification methylase domain-containing protein n=1 Tax=Haladaptatus sp. AB618 TaxID=2934173 RepID=UPI00209C42DB|nr:TaqI-like C-terminal specificity domain-containing protein [Haladaptatus sp. AB618]MCO8256747.1 N-6 DNA methylase [Haladaptatus sp. AB618]
MAQQSHPYRTNRDLFSNHYLTEHLRQTEPWQDVDQDEVRDTYEEIRKLWEKKQERVDDYNEAQLERNFIRPIFDILNIPFEIEETVKRNARRPDYGFFSSEDAADAAFDRDDFYEEAIAVADAKRWGRKLDTRGEEKRDFENPSYQIHAYLQETPVQWAVLTNGKQWRLYYGPTSHRLDSYYEIDLPELLRDVEEDGKFEDFKDFYLFFRQKAFLADQSGNCFLDEVYDESSVFAEAIGEDLQDNIYDAIRVLAQGFLDSNDDLDEDDLPLIHDSSLIYLYRLIFVLYAESEGRDLLPTDNEIYSESYGLNELKREVADKRDETQQHYQTWQTNLWDTLGELFVLIDQGSQGKNIPKDQLYIPAYNGGLFRTNPDPDDNKETRFLATHEADDAHLAEVIDLLTRRDADEGDGQVFVDYSSLDERHLGSIYEGLLEYQLDVADEPLTVEDGEYSPAVDDDEVAVEEGDVYLRTDDGERKATGSYYTPEYVVEYIVDGTLGPLVDDIREDLVGTESYHEGGFAGEFAERVFDLKVLDPAMGSGHFPVNAVDYLAREIIDAQERQDQQAVKRGDEEAISEPRTEEGELRDINWARRKVAQRCIFGVDLNPLATELSKVSLWLRTLAAEQPLAFLDHHLKTGNSLVGSDVTEVLSNDTETNSGQLTLQQALDRVRQNTLEHVMNRMKELLEIDNETLEDVKSMEEIYAKIREDPFYRRLFELTNVHTAEQFNLDVPEKAYEQMAQAIDDENKWIAIREKDWFQTAQEMHEEMSFFHWELQYPEVFFDNEGKIQENAGFDAVIGNPPYRALAHGRRQEAADEDLQKYLRDKYPEASEYNQNLFTIFIDESTHLMTKGGIFGMVVPNTLLTNYYFKNIRNKILAEFEIATVVDAGIRVFDEVETGGVTIPIIRNTKPNESSKVSIVRLDEDRDFEVVDSVYQDKYQDIPYQKILLEPSKLGVLSKIQSVNSTIGEESTMYAGIVSGDNEKYLSDSATEPEHEKVVRGRDITRYNIKWNSLYIYFDEEELYSNTDRDMFEAAPKILMRQTGDHLIAAVDSEGIYSLKTTHLVIPDEINPYYIASCLNSNALNWYYQQIVPEQGRTFAEVKAVNVKQLPIPAKRSNITIDGPEDTGINGNVEETLTKLAKKMEKYKRSRKNLNLNLLDYFGSYSNGQTLAGIGFNQPPKGMSDSILELTAEDRENLRIGAGKVIRESPTSIEVRLTARYKPKENDEFETDQWGYTETDPLPALKISDLTKDEADLIEVFLPVALDKAGGFANFRETATKTNSLVDRIRKLTLPAVDDVRGGLRNYLETRTHAEEIDAKIERTDQDINEIVYELFELTEEEIEKIEEVSNEAP